MLPEMVGQARDTEGLVERLQELLDPRVEVLDAYLFGSSAAGRAQSHSDVDVAVFVEPELATGGPFGYRAELATVLIAGLGSNAVDVVVLNSAPPLLYHRVLRDGIRVLARDLRATTTREGAALSRYCDFIPQFDKLKRARQRPASGR